MAKLHVYYHPNVCGTFCAVVAAKNQREAVDRLNGTVGDFRRYGGRRLEEGDPGFAEAMQEPGKVWYRLIGESVPWQDHRRRVT